jgi:uncharacterized protein YqjF (DUF2071 family)
MHEFQEQFGTEEARGEYLYKKRWPNGFICPKRGHTERFNIKSRNRYQRKTCGHQTTATAGTIMEKTRTPLTKWFAAKHMSYQQDMDSRRKMRYSYAMPVDMADVLKKLGRHDHMRRNVK